MRTRLINLGERLRCSFWFLPLLLVLAAALLALQMVNFDEQARDGQWRLPPGIDKSTAEGARAVLSVVAGAMISVTGITFSITIVTLTLASSQFGPRLLRNFMADTGNQVVMGVFLATFVYCLLVLRRVHGPPGPVFVPHLSVTVAVALAMGSLGALIYFIHHVAHSIQAENVIAAVGADLDKAIDERYPESIGSAPKDEWEHDESTSPDSPDHETVTVESARTGYLQAVEGDGLLELASEANLTLRLHHHPGDFLIAGSPLASVWPCAGVDEALAEKINSQFLLGDQRTGEQDIEFAAHQLVEVALRALSPGINDTFTAINCIDRLGASLSKLAGRKTPSEYRYDREGRLRVITAVDHFKGVLDTSLDQIRQNSRNNAATTIRLLEILREIAWHARRPSHLAAISRQAEMIERGAREAMPEVEDRKDISARYREIVRLLERKTMATDRGDSAD